MNGDGNNVTNLPTTMNKQSVELIQQSQKPKQSPKSIEASKADLSVLRKSSPAMQPAK